MGLDNLVRWIIGIPIILLALTVHEFSHGLVAFLRGDNTAKEAGRLTLNPISHLDLMGSVLLLISFYQGFVFGWAKPVPVNTNSFKNPKLDIF